MLCIEINTKENENLWDLDEDDLIKKIKNELDQMKIFDINKIDDYKIFKFKNLYHMNGSDGNSISEKIVKITNSLKNEFILSVEIDTGTNF